MPIRSLSIAFFLLVSGLRAQHIVDLAAAGPVPVPAGLHVDSVITSFDGTASIGSVMKGMMNRPVPAFLAPSVGPAIAAALGQPPAGPSDRHVFLRVNVLRISERTMGMTELAPCALNFDVLQRTDSGAVLLFEYACTISSSSGMDATKKHPRNIRDNLAEGLRNFAAAAQRGSLWHVPVHGRDLAAPPSRTAYAVLGAGHPVRGLYRTFMDLRDQRPDTITPFDVKYVSDSDPRLQQAKLKVANDTLEDDIWGFCDGQAFYMNMGRRYVRLLHGENGFSAWYPTTASSNAYIAPGIMFGMIGVLVMQASQPGGPLTLFDLDLLTGSMRTPQAASEAPARSEHVFIYSRHCAMDTVLDMTIYGGPEARLKRGTHHWVRLVPRAEEVPVMLHFGSGTPVQVDVRTDVVDDAQVHLIKVDEEGHITVDLLNPDMAHAQLAKLDPAKEVK